VHFEFLPLDESIKVICGKALIVNSGGLPPISFTLPFVKQKPMFLKRF